MQIWRNDTEKHEDIFAQHFISMTETENKAEF